MSNDVNAICLWSLAMGLYLTNETYQISPYTTQVCSIHSMSHTISFCQMATLYEAAGVNPLLRCPSFYNLSMTDV